jgi:hypothetical protein
MKRYGLETAGWVLAHAALLTRGLPLAIAIFVVLVGLCNAGTIDLGDSMRELVEADWVRADKKVELAHTWHVIERSKALSTCLRREGASKSLDPLTAQLSKLESQLANLETSGEVPHETRRGIYFDIRRLARRIAFCNPLLDFDKLLFIKRHDSGGVFHETHEWNPSVDNDGMLVYTRWDYFDRDTNIAHHIWTSYPDGRSPRSFHGNYPLQRQSRPWMEMSIRAIPGSHRYVASTGAHHGNAFGSLVMIDPRIEDNRAIAQLTRLTPDTPFPEAEARPIRDYMRYGTP